MVRQNQEELITGVVRSIRLDRDTLILDTGRPGPVLINTAEGRLTFNGRACKPVELMRRISTSRNKVRVWTLSIFERFGACLDADFAEDD